MVASFPSPFHNAFTCHLLSVCKNIELVDKRLDIKLLHRIQPFVDSVDQDQTAQIVQSDLGSTLSNKDLFSSKVTLL